MTGERTDRSPGTDLAARQAALVAALVAGAPVPPGFDTRRVAAVRDALLRKRAGEVARHWPMLAAALGSRWRPLFVAWARNRPPTGGLRDGWEFARTLLATGGLPPAAIDELAAREAGWRLPDQGPPRPRRVLALIRTGGMTVLRVTRWTWVLRRPVGGTPRGTA